MAYPNIQMFMEKLKQLIYSNDIPLINNPSILCERPQFQLLYEELDTMIQTLFNHENQDLHNFEEVRKLKKRFKTAAEEAEDIVDIFLSAVYCRNNGYSPRSDVFQPSLHLEEVTRSIESIKIEFITMNIDNMKMDSSLRTDRLQMQSTGTSLPRNSMGSKKLSEKIVVGIDRDAEIIRDKPLWETGEEQFQRLKFMRLENLNIKQWEASSINFPCLKDLEVLNCVDLEEIPLELGDISTLKSIYVENCGASLLASLQQIRQEQDDAGNYELEIIVDGRNMPSCVPRNDD